MAIASASMRSGSRSSGLMASASWTKLGASFSTFSTRSPMRRLVRSHYNQEPVRIATPRRRVVVRRTAVRTAELPPHSYARYGAGSQPRSPPIRTGRSPSDRRSGGFSVAGCRCGEALPPNGPSGKRSLALKGGARCVGILPPTSTISAAGEIDRSTFAPCARPA